MLKTHITLPKSVLYLLCLVTAATPSRADTSSHPLRAGSLTQNWMDAGLITVNNDWSQVPSIMGYLGDYTSSTPVNVDPRTLLNMDNTTISVVAQGTATASAGAVYELQNGNASVALHASGTADAPYLLFHLDSSLCAGVNVSYTLREMDADNAPNMVDLQFRVGSSGSWTSVPGGFVVFGSTSNEVFSINANLPPAAANQSQLQVRVITTNATGVDTMIGVDDIVISATGQPVVVTTSATGITAYAATLRGTVETAGGPMIAWFEYSVDSTFSTGVMATAEQAVPAGAATLELTTAVSGLLAEKTYFYRLVARNDFGTTQGDAVPFLSSYPTASDEWFGAEAGLAVGGRLYRPLPGVINHAGRITFKALATPGTGGITAANDALLLTDSSGTLRVIGQEGMLAPQGGSVSGLFNNLVITPNGCSVSLERFAGTASSRDHGYLVSEDGLGLDLLSCEGDAAECGGLFTSQVTRHATDHAERVYFSSTLASVPFSKNSGVWCDAAGSLAVFAKEGQDITPLTGDLAWLGNVSPMVAAAGDGASFIALFQNNPDNAQQKTLIAANAGLFSGSSEGLELVARKGTTLPDVGKINTFNAVSRGSSGDHAFVSLLGLSQAAPVVMVANDQVLLAEREGQIHLIARENSTELLPGLKPARFGSFYMTSTGEVVFQAWVTGAGVTTANDSLICRWSETAGIRVVAREGATAPGSGMNYGSFQILSVSPGGAIALQSTLSTGLALMRALPGDELELVVRTGTPLHFQGADRGILSLGISQTGAGVGGGGGGLGAAINDNGAVFTVLSLGNQDYVARIYR